MLLAEELLDLTLEELINDYGVEIVAVETWYGYDFEARMRGTVVNFNTVVDAELLPLDLVEDEYYEPDFTVASYYETLNYEEDYNGR